MNLERELVDGDEITEPLGHAIEGDQRFAPGIVPV
jgi:hypothetical protein